MKKGRKGFELVNIGFSGVGGHGKMIQWATEESGMYNVRGVFDVNPEESKNAARRFSAEEESSYEDLLARDDIEAVFIATPNFVHFDQVTKAFERGLHVFVEKPLAANMKEATRLVEMSEEAGKLFMVGHNIRYGRAARLTNELIQEGRLGDIVSIDVHYSADNTQRMPPTAWRLDPDKCTMLPVMQLGIHGLDLVHYLTDPIREVSAYARSVTTRPEVVDSVTAIFKTGNGIHGTMTSNYCSLVDFSLYIAGTRSNIRCTPHVVDIQKAEDTNSRCEGPAERFDFLQNPDESYVRELVEFAQAVRGEGEIEADGWSGLRAQAVVEAMQTSIELGTHVEIPEYP